MPTPNTTTQPEEAKNPHVAELEKFEAKYGKHYTTPMLMSHCVMALHEINEALVGIRAAIGYFIQRDQQANEKGNLILPR